MNMALATSSPVSPNSPSPPTTDATKLAGQAGQKVFYLMCVFCRWSTRDVGIPDVFAGKKLLKERHFRI